MKRLTIIVAAVCLGWFGLLSFGSAMPVHAATIASKITKHCTATYDYNIGTKDEKMKTYDCSNEKPVVISTTASAFAIPSATYCGNSSGVAYSWSWGGAEPFSQVGFNSHVYYHVPSNACSMVQLDSIWVAKDYNSGNDYTYWDDVKYGNGYWAVQGSVGWSPSEYTRYTLQLGGAYHNKNLSVIVDMDIHEFGGNPFPVSQAVGVLN